jgi:N utilization substance protein B
MNEAIEIAKNLGGTESGSFVNGVLHKIAQKLRPKSEAKIAKSEIKAEEAPSS